MCLLFAPLPVLRGGPSDHSPHSELHGVLGDLSPIEQQLVVAGAKARRRRGPRSHPASALRPGVQGGHARAHPVTVRRALCAGALPCSDCWQRVLLAFRCNELAVLRHRYRATAPSCVRRSTGMGFCSVLEKVMPQLLAAGSSAELLLVFGVFFSVYVLSMVLVLVRRRRRDEDGGALPSDRFVPDADTREMLQRRKQSSFLGHRHHRRCSRPLPLPNA